MKQKPLLIVSGYFSAYLAACLLFKGSGYTDQYYILISVATFLYGIFIAFSIYNHQSRIGRMRELLRTDDSYLLTIYRQSSVFGKHVQDDIRDLIDSYLIAQIDYRLIMDYHESADEFRDLHEYVIALKSKTDQQATVYQNMMDLASNLLVTRKLVGTLARQKMTTLEWLSIISLHSLIAYFVFAFNKTVVSSSIFSALLVTAGVVMIYVLYELNNLTWQEKDWIWRPLHNLFLDLDLTPYYPDIIIGQKRASIPKDSLIRVCEYGKPYPDMSGNRIRMIRH